MANIKVYETMLSNVNITDSGDILGLNFTTNMNLATLETMFTPATSPEIRVVDGNGNVVTLYKNRKLITLTVRAGEVDNIVDIALQVTPAKIEEVEALTNQVNAQAVQIEVQTVTNNEQAAQITEQTNVIDNLKRSLNDTQIALGSAQEELTTTKIALAEAEFKIIETETALTATQSVLNQTQASLMEAQDTNMMLMECVLEMSEVVYA